MKSFETSETCPFRIEARHARCVLWLDHDGEHDIRGDEDPLAAMADRRDRVNWMLR